MLTGWAFIGGISKGTGRESKVEWIHIGWVGEEA